MKSSDEKQDSLQITSDDYKKKLKYDQFVNFVQKQEPIYFEENPQFFKYFGEEIAQNI